MKQQRGFILPLLMAILLIGGLLYHFDAKRLASDLARVRLERTRAALAEAREALIAHAATYHLMPDHSATNPRLGLLPCPDTDGSGSATLTDCKSMNDAVLGRLPIGRWPCRDWSTAMVNACGTRWRGASRTIRCQTKP